MSCHVKGSESGRRYTSDPTNIRDTSIDVTFAVVKHVFVSQCCEQQVTSLRVQHTLRFTRAMIVSVSHRDVTQRVTFPKCRAGTADPHCPSPHSHSTVAAHPKPYILSAYIHTLASTEHTYR
jgi:hypothetical protein